MSRGDKMQFSLGVFPLYEDGKTGDAVLETVGTAAEICHALQHEVVKYGTYSPEGWGTALDITIAKV